LHPPQKFESLTKTIFRSSIKWSSESDKTCRYVHDLSLYHTSFL